MIRRILFWITGSRPARLIKLDGRPYLERYYVGTLLGYHFYLHRFVRDDHERHVHDHPWKKAFSLVLAGQYIEQRGYVSDRIRVKGIRVRWFNFIQRLPGSHCVHRITGTQPETWTLFFHGPWDYEWGFYTIDDQGHYEYTPYKIDRAKKYWWLEPETVNGNQIGREPFGG